MKFKSEVVYQEQLDPTFFPWLKTNIGAEHIEKCIQCGTCSGSCPLSSYMDYTPRRLVAMSRAGMKEEVLNSFTIWLCSSCYNCTLQCPSEIKVTDIMYILKQRAIKENKYPKRFPIPVLSKEFFNFVLKNGRNSEMIVVTKLLLKTNLFKIFGMAPIGMKLFKTGRMKLISDSIKDKKNFRKILDAIEE